MKRRGRFVLSGVTLACLLGPQTVRDLHATNVQGIRSIDLAPHALRGGVLMLPLAALRPGDHWPRTLRLRLADNRSITGAVAWVMQDVDPTCHWTREAAGLTTRMIEPGDDSGSGVGTPFALFDLPADAPDGPIDFERQRLRPRWLQMPAAPRNERVMAVTRRDDRPDPVSPFAHWRWVLLAERLKASGPTLDRFTDPIERLVARHYAGLWRAGLGRLERQSPAVAAVCRDRLTETGFDGDHAIAMWVSEQTETTLLLALLLDSARHGKSLADAALGWVERQPTVFVWPEVADGRRVRLAAANSGTDDAVVTARWRSVGDIPVALEVPTKGVGRLSVDRPSMSPGDGDRTQILEITLPGGATKQLTFFRPTVVATPPGVFFTALQPPHTLADIRSGTTPAVDKRFATLTHFRRLDGRWEVFLECRRDEPRLADDPSSRETIELTVVADDELLGRLRVAETGPLRMLAGSDDGTLAVHRRSKEDRWVCRIVLPKSWAVLGRAVGIGLRRTHAGTTLAETGPYRTLPWRSDPGRIEIDLTMWDDGP